MRSVIKYTACAPFLLVLAIFLGAQDPKAEGFRVPVTYYKLSNGLRVVLSQDSTSPTVQRVTETYLVPGKMTIVVVGDTAKVADQLKPYATSGE